MPKITFPHMGPYTHVFRWFLDALGWEVVMPDRPNQSTLSLGVKHSPEFYCLPFKICLGTYLEGLERGADTIISSGGYGPCRAGHYTQVQEDILRRMGYPFDMIVLEAVGRYPIHFLRCFRRLNRARHSVLGVVRILKLGLRKLAVIDELEARLRYLRPRELRRASAEEAFAGAVALVAAAGTPEATERARVEGLDLMAAVPHDPHRPTLRVGMAGEIYVLLEPASNLEMEKLLGELGVEVHRPMTLSGWTAENAVTEVHGTAPKTAAMP
ncbi:MAG TPA: CoA protein activase, partial [Symbiobacteriaceae bacterium]|nr:CoA protein activase [Symbiobacteriaceae bacterium]